MSRSTTERFHRSRVFLRWLKKYQVIPVLSALGLIPMFLTAQSLFVSPTERNLTIFAFGVVTIFLGMTVYDANKRTAAKWLHYLAWGVLWIGFILFLIAIPSPFGKALTRSILTMGLFGVSFIIGHLQDIVKTLFPHQFEKK